MSFCTNCGTQLPEGAQNCPHCSASTALPPCPPQQAYPGVYQQPQPKSNTLAYLIGCPVAAVFGLVILGILAAIAIPDFMKFQAKAKQSEAKTNLGQIFTSQVAYYGANNTYGETFDQIGWTPKGDTFYTYYLADEVISSARGQASPLPAGVKTFVENQSFLAVAAGNIDNDSTLDIWTVNEAKEIKNIQNDLME